MKAYSISKFGNWNNSGGSFPDKLLLSRRLPRVEKYVISQKYKHSNNFYIKRSTVLSVECMRTLECLEKPTNLQETKLALESILLVVREGQATYKWTRLGNPDSSDGISPLIELLFMWLSQKVKRGLQKPLRWKGSCRNIFSFQKQKRAYKCFVAFKFAKDLGISPDIWFWSICILSKCRRLPRSSGNEPDNWFPFRSL